MNAEQVIVRDGEDYRLLGNEPAWLRVADVSFLVKTLDGEGETVLVVAYPYGKEDGESIGSMHLTVCEDETRVFPHGCENELRETVIERDGEDYILESETGWLRVGNLSLRFACENGVSSVQAFPYGREDEEALETMNIEIGSMSETPHFS